MPALRVGLLTTSAGNLFHWSNQWNLQAFASKCLNISGGVKRSKLVPRQIVWPASFKPGRLHSFLAFLSEELLSVFCSVVEHHKGL